MGYKKFDFDDINLVPKKCIVNSRSECNTSLNFGGFNFKLPIVPANMECVLNIELAEKLARNGYFYIMHRFDVDVEKFILNMKTKSLPTSISIGVNEDSYELVDTLIEKCLIPDYITIDIAHGHSIKMEKMLTYLNQLKSCGKLYSFIIAGNVSTKEGVIDLENWGADCVKVGIGPGSACTTYPATGFGSRNCQASTIKFCADVAKKPIIADGGIKEIGDVSKSLVMGATMVMIGGMMSGFIDSPGDIISYDGKKYKEFWGSASQHQSNKKNRIEGKKNIIELKNKSIIDEMIFIEECLQSSISYAGGSDLSCFNQVEYTFFQ